MTLFQGPARVVARWETSGHDYLELLQDDDGYFRYRGRNCGGVLAVKPHAPDAIAIWRMEEPNGPVSVLCSDRSSLRRVR